MIQNTEFVIHPIMYDTAYFIHPITYDTEHFIHPISYIHSTEYFIHPVTYDTEYFIHPVMIQDTLFILLRYSTLYSSHYVRYRMQKTTIIPLPTTQSTE